MSGYIGSASQQTQTVLYLLPVLSPKSYDGSRHRQVQMRNSGDGYTRCGGVPKTG